MGVAQELFEGAVLTVLDEVLRTDRRIDLVADDHLRASGLESLDSEIRPDLIICVAECVRMMATLPGGRSHLMERFPAFEAAWRALPTAHIDSTVSRIQGALQRLTTAFLQVRHHANAERA